VAHDVVGQILQAESLLVLDASVALGGVFGSHEILHLCDAVLNRFSHDEKDLRVNENRVDYVFLCVLSGVCTVSLDDATKVVKIFGLCKLFPYIFIKKA
jgi:hypothetical protein